METFLSGFAKGYTTERARVQDAKREDEKEAKALKLRADERLQDFKMRREERDETRTYQRQKDAADAAQRAAERAADRNYRKEDILDERTYEEKRDGVKSAAEIAKEERQAAARLAERGLDRKDQLADKLDDRGYEAEKERKAGFMAAEKERKDRQYERENFTLKYGLENLTKNKDKRDLKSEKIRLEAEQARQIAAAAGIPDAAADIAKDIALVGGPEAQKRAMNGQYKRNPNYVEPERTVKVPQAVSEPYSTGVTEVDAQIDALDPTLRQADNEDTGIPAEGSKYTWKPENTEKIGPYAQVTYEYQQAVLNNDPKAAADAKLKMKIHEGIMTQEAMAEAKAKGTNVRSYVMLNENGEIESQFAGELRPTDSGEALFNVSNPDVDAHNNRIAKPVAGNAVPLDEDGTKRYFDLTRQFGKQSADYNTSTDKYVGALSTMDTIQQILARNQAVTTMSSNAAVLVKEMQSEAGGLYQMIANEQEVIDQAISSGDPNAQSSLPALIAKNEKNLQDFQSQFMAEGNTNLAYDKALYEGQRKLLAYQMAAANGITGAGLNKKDYDNFYEATGGHKSAPEVLAAMATTSKGVLSTVDSARVTLDSNEEVRAFEKFYKIKTGLAPTRLQEKIERMGPEYQHLIPVLQGITRANAEGRAMAVQGATGQQPAQQQAQPDEFGRVVGQVYPGANGKMFKYNGGGLNPKNFEEVK